MVPQVAAKALRLLPNEAGLWAYVAAWNYQHQLDPESARALLQAGLRNCPSSEDLWLDYVRFELSYAHKLLARREVRGIPLPGTSAQAPDAQKVPERDVKHMKLPGGRVVQFAPRMASCRSVRFLYCR